MPDASRQPSARPYTVAVDTREQLPYKWRGVTCQDSTLQAGDYSVVGLESVVAVERKSLADFYGCLADGRERFENSLHRLAAIRYPLVVVECTTEDLLQPYTYASSGGEQTSEVQPLTAQNSLLSWQARYRIPFLPCGSRAGGARFTLQHLDLIWRMHRDGETGEHAGIELARGDAS